MPERAPSVRRRLLAFLLLPLALMLGIGIVFDYQSGTAPVRRAYDEVLREATLAIAAHLDADNGVLRADLPQQAIDVLRSDSRDAIYYLVRGPHGEAISGDQDLPIGVPVLGATVYEDANYGGAPIRIASYATLVGDARVTIGVAETLHKRASASRRILLGIVVSDGLQLIGTLLLIWLGVRHGVRPLRALSERISVRSARELTPLDPAEVPGEVRPLVQALNGLLAAARSAAHAQQQFLANAAHQLRTPLAGIIAQLDLLAHEPDARPVRERLLDLHAATRRLAHTANQLLALARAEPSANLAHDFHRVDLAALVADSVGQHLDRSLIAQIDLGAESEPTFVHGSEWLLRELLANLVDNAFQYTPPAGRITLRCGSMQRAAFLEVEDDGVGIAEADRAHILERFYRVPGSPGSGCGLGLAIVDEIARVHEARLTIGAGANARGTLVRVDFPPR